MEKTLRESALSKVLDNLGYEKVTLDEGLLHQGSTVKGLWSDNTGTVLSVDPKYGVAGVIWHKTGIKGFVSIYDLKLINEAFVNGRTQAQQGIGIYSRDETKSRVGKLVDYYHPSNGDKKEGTMTFVGKHHYIIKDHKTKTQHHFKYPEDHVNEEVEQVDEISKSTLASYQDKAHSHASDLRDKLDFDRRSLKVGLPAKHDKEERSKMLHKHDNRMSGFYQAHKKMHGHLDAKSGPEEYKYNTESKPDNNIRRPVKKQKILAKEEIEHIEEAKKMTSTRPELSDYQASILHGKASAAHKKAADEAHQHAAYHSKEARSTKVLTSREAHAATEKVATPESVHHKTSLAGLNHTDAAKAYHSHAAAADWHKESAKTHHDKWWNGMSDEEKTAHKKKIAAGNAAFTYMTGMHKK